MLRPAKRVIRQSARRSIHECLRAFEAIIVSFAKHQAPATIWIVGPPRSGTTLLYQLLIERYYLGYLSTFAAKFYRAPVLATHLAKLLFSRKSIRDPYASEYGTTQHPLAPSEAGEFWYRWFPRGEDIYVPAGGLESASLVALRDEVAALAKIDGMPVIFKNTYNSMRLGPIIEAFPQACFLVCQRNPATTARSILKGRVARGGSKETWWSLPPKEIDEIRKHPYCEQVVEQVYYIYKQIEKDRAQFGQHRFLDVNYEDICNDAHSVLARIETFLGHHGIHPAKRGEVPAQFPLSSGGEVDPEDEQCIQQKVALLWK